jgi:hypothetical protein
MLASELMRPIYAWQFTALHNEKNPFDVSSALSFFLECYRKRLHSEFEASLFCKYPLAGTFKHTGRRREKSELSQHPVSGRFDLAVG